MGFLLRARAPLKKKGLFLSSRISIKQIVDAILDGTRRTPLEAVTSSEKYRENGFDIMLHPAAGPLKVEVAEDWVTVETKTSTAGPGFHAYVVSILDQTQRALGLKWEWDDETGYVQERDFESLQAQMAFFLNHLAIHMLKEVETVGATGTKIFMPVDFGAEPREGEIFTPMGPMTVADLQQWAGTDVDGQIAGAADFFPWWGQGFDGSFFRGLALHSLWMDIRWPTPLDSEEVELTKRTLRWCSQTLKLGAELPIPESAIIELSDLIVSEEHRRPLPKEDGIGYRRRLWKRSVTGDWKATMPGSLKETVEEADGKTTTVIGCDGLDIRVSVYTAPLDDKHIAAGAFDGEVTKIDRRIDRLETSVTVLAFARTFKAKDRAHICLLTITSTTPDMGALGQRIAESLAYEPPRRA